METGEELVTKKLYQLYERDQEYQQTPFHSRHSRGWSGGAMVLG